MTDEVKKNDGKNQGQPGQQQQKNPQDVSKQPHNTSQDRNKELDEKQGQPEQGGQRRAS
jgi:hypothetical protein